jgi:hypothetical protein
MLPDKKGSIYGNDPNYNYIPSTPEFQKEWVETLVKNFHSASQGGVKFYQMDNEPGLWSWNHRDVRPQGLGYDDMVELNADYAEAVKEADPDAQVIGMTAWGVKELAGSAWDYMPGGKEGYKLGEGAIQGNGWTDRKAHGDMPQVAYFLREMNKRSQKAGKRLIDYLDDHGFPEVWGKNAQGQSVNVLGDFDYDPVLTPKQFDALRIFYDPTFEDPESWCANASLKPYLFDPFRPLIPNLKKMIAQYYPGTKLSMTEYYPASSHHYHGGLLEIVTLGIFMREGMDLACDWGSTWEGFHLGGQFGIPGPPVLRQLRRQGIEGGRGLRELRLLHPRPLLLRGQERRQELRDPGEPQPRQGFPNDGEPSRGGGELRDLHDVGKPRIPAVGLGETQGPRGRLKHPRPRLFSPPDRGGDPGQWGEKKNR